MTDTKNIMALIERVIDNSKSQISERGYDSQKCAKALRCAIDGLELIKSGGADEIGSQAGYWADSALAEISKIVGGE